MVREKWRKQDPALQAKRCGAGFFLSGDEKIVKLPFFGQIMEATHPEGDVKSAESGEKPPISEQILILHYLSSDYPFPETDKLIAYSEIPDGKFYDAPYQKRTRNYLLGVFGTRLETLKAAAKMLDAEFEDRGDIAFSLEAFPKVRVHFVCWEGDDEFEPEASVLWENSVQAFLDAESIAVLGTMAVGRLAKAAREIKE